MGGDHGPPVVIPAVARAIASLPGSVRFLLHGDETILRMSKVAVGPMADEQAGSIRTYGDIGRFEEALRRVVER